jgi:hypothetical protein
VQLASLSAQLRSGSALPLGPQRRCTPRKENQRAYRRTNDHRDHGNRVPDPQSRNDPDLGSAVQRNHGARPQRAGGAFCVAGLSQCPPPSRCGHSVFRSLCRSALGAKMKDRSLYQEPERILADLDHISAYWGRQAASQRNGVRARHFAKKVDQARTLAARIRESMG